MGQYIDAMGKKLDKVEEVKDPNVDTSIALLHD